MNPPPVVAVNCDNRKLWGKKNGTKRGLEKKKKTVQFRKKTITKWKSNLKSIKSYNISSYFGESWKVITIMKFAV